MNLKIVTFMVTFALGLVLARVSSEAQQPTKVPRIGYVTETGDFSSPSPNLEAFRQGLRDLGYVEGKNIVIEFRSAEGKPDRVPSLVAEPVQLKVDVLVSQTTTGILAARQATKTFLLLW
jgi:putative ABC transport system substrate-binding protein